jgi:pyrimidine-nucleoside phosphorylase
MKAGQYSVPDIIARKQQGASLTRKEIDWFVRASAAGEIPDYQISAFLMAVFFRGMTIQETRDFTRAMIDTGKVLDLKSIPQVKVDKHSTGGVGDKISLILGPLVASVGVHVPMISGRGLGHTGGTLDKLEAIPGFRTDLDPRRFERIVSRVGISIIGQTDEIAPADRKFYAIRDVTSTIVCPPLIVGSILSKKIASGTDAVVFDIKCGEGAFMKTVRQARDLAGFLSKVASMLGLKTSAVLTSMEEPLGHCVGNAIEVREVIEVLRGRWVDDLVDVTLALGSEMVILAGKAKTRREAYTLLRSALLGGKALQKFRDLVKAQGGDPAVVDKPQVLRLARHRTGIRAGSKGYVSNIDALEVGRIAALLGAGRLRSEDRVDHAVGIEFLKKTGDPVKKGEALALIYASKPSTGRRCAGLLRSAISLSTRKPGSRPTVIGKVTPRGIRSLLED